MIIFKEKQKKKAHHQTSPFWVRPSVGIQVTYSSDDTTTPVRKQDLIIISWEAKMLVMSFNQMKSKTFFLVNHPFQISFWILSRLSPDWWGFWHIFGRVWQTPHDLPCSSALNRTCYRVLSLQAYAWPSMLTSLYVSVSQQIHTFFNIFALKYSNTNSKFLFSKFLLYFNFFFT